MKVTLVADSCFLFEYKGIRLLTDPWIGGFVYDGAWLQYPPPVIKAEDIGKLDYIFISHIHEDHCDLETLKYLDRSAKVLVMDRDPNFVEKFLIYHQLNFAEIIRLPIRKKYCVDNELYFETIEADPKHTLNHLIDSSLLIHFGSKSIYFANDNLPYPEIDDYLSQYNFDLVLLPPTGVSGYPACYSNLTDTEKIEKAHSIRTRYYEEMLGCLRRLNPRLFGCVATAHVLSGIASELNKFMAWPASTASPYQYIKEHRLPDDGFKPILQLPGDTIDLSVEKGVSDESAIKFYEDTINKQNFILQKSTDASHAFMNVRLNPSISFPHLITLAHQRLVSYLKRANVNIPWYYAIEYSQEKEYALIHLFSPYELNLGVSETSLPKTQRLIISTDLRLLFLLLTGAFSWNAADIAGFIRYHRCPDQYIFEMYTAINYLRI